MAGTKPHTTEQFREPGVPARPGRATLLWVLLLVAGCAGRDDSRVESITPARPSALAGAPTDVDVSVSGDCWRTCRETARPVLELDTGKPLPPSLRYELEPISFGTYIANPGTGSPFDSGPASCPGWTYTAWPLADDMFLNCRYTQGFRGFSIRLVADPATRPTSIGLRLRIPDCGGELLASFTLDLVGNVQAPGMCARSTGAPCGVDADCSAGGCYDAYATCGAAPPPFTICFGSPLPGPAGSACGCVAGICSWH